MPMSSAFYLSQKLFGAWDVSEQSHPETLPIVSPVAAGQLAQLALPRYPLQLRAEIGGQDGKPFYERGGGVEEAGL
jgi:hypothetical protein